MISYGVAGEVGEMPQFPEFGLGQTLDPTKPISGAVRWSDPLTSPLLKLQQLFRTESSNSNGPAKYSYKCMRENSPIYTSNLKIT